MQSEPVRQIVKTIFMKWALRRERRKFQRALPSVAEGLAQLLEAGLPLQLALHHLHDLAPKLIQRKYISKARMAIDMGQTLSRAWQDDVSNLFFILLTAGERSGKIPRSLRAWRDFVIERKRWWQQMSKALVYPSIILSMSGGLVLFVVVVVFPTLENMYNELHLGDPQLILMLRTQVYILLEAIPVSMVCAVTGLVLLYRIRNQFPRVWSSIYDKLPGTKLLWLYRTNVISLLLYLLLDAGIPLIDGLEMLALDSEKNWRIKALNVIHARILNGQSLLAAFSGNWDGMLQVFVGWAEQTGDIAQAFREVERATRERLQQRVDKLIRYAEPILVMLMGSIVAGTMLMVFVPMYDLVTSISSGHAMG